MPNLYFCNISAKLDYSRWLTSTFLWNVHVHKILRLSVGNLPTFICYHITIVFFFFKHNKKIFFNAGISMDRIVFQ